MTHFDGSEGFDVEIRIQGTQLAQELEIPIFLQCRVQTANHVHLRDSKGERIAYDSDNFVNRVFESVRIAFLGGKSAELARENANVRVIDVSIVNVGGVVAVLSFTNNAGNHPEPVEIA